MQKPSIGRIVLATVDPRSNNGSDVAPAVITRVFGDDLVNVRVLLDGSDAPWKTSIRLHEDRETLEAAAEKWRADLGAVGNDVNLVFHAAYWPPRV